MDLLRPKIYLLSKIFHWGQFFLRVAQYMNWLNGWKNCSTRSYNFIRVDVLVSHFNSRQWYVSLPDVWTPSFSFRLNETMSICADYLHRCHLGPPMENILIELIVLSTKFFSFSFNDTMYRQVDGISMGSPLGHLLAYVFLWGSCNCSFF